MKDLTKGYPAKVIILFAIPMIFGSIFQQLYNIADSKIVSTFVGTEAFAAVGATSVVSNTLIGFLNSLTLGFAIPIANSFGGKDYKRMRRIHVILSLTFCCNRRSPCRTSCRADAGRGSCAYRVNLAFDSCDSETSGNTGRYYEPGTCVCANHFIWHYICVCL